MINNNENSIIEFNEKHPKMSEILNSNNDNSYLLELFLLETRRAQHIQEFDYD